MLVEDSTRSTSIDFWGFTPLKWVNDESEGHSCHTRAIRICQLSSFRFSVKHLCFPKPTPKLFVTVCLPSCTMARGRRNSVAVTTRSCSLAARRQTLALPRPLLSLGAALVGEHYGAGEGGLALLLGGPQLCRERKRTRISIRGWSLSPGVAEPDSIR